MLVSFEAKKKIVTMEEKREELTTCYICLSKMKWPLQICATGHFACADCLHKQCISSESVVRHTDNTGFIPVFTFVWKMNFECGLCKKQANPKYAGPLVTQLIDPEPILNCPKCNQKFSESSIGMHVLKCTDLECPLCRERCDANLLNDHVKKDCLKVPCKKCKFKSSYVMFQWHMKEHEIVKRTLKGLPRIVRNISHNVGMQRFHLLLQAFFVEHCVNRTRSRF